ncbi:MAG: hypothetical protein RL722_2452 [Pseudomonadota bacterium]|jgi:DNA-binding transcriptional LysR family regulator
MGTMNAMPPDDSLLRTPPPAPSSGEAGPAALDAGSTKPIDALWPHLHALCVLATMGSYTAAARRLGLSKAAVSQRVAELEKAAGLPLVRRTTRSMRLTAAGEQLVEAARLPFEAIERGFSHVKDLAGHPRGLLRVSAPVALARQQIVPRVPDFLALYPEVRIELELSDRLVSLAQEGFDLAIRHTQAAPDTHVAWRLCATQAWLVAAPAYLARRGAPAHPADLARHDCLHYLRPGEGVSWSFVAEAGPPTSAPPDSVDERLSVAVRGPFAANNSEALREAALAGVGIALLPDFSAQQEVSAGRLQRVLPAWRSVGAFGEQLYAIRPYSAQVPRAVSAFVDFLREALRDGFPVSPGAGPGA